MEMNAIDDTWCAAAGLGNVLPDHTMVLKHGLNHVIAQAERRIKELDLTEPGAISQYWFLQAVVTSNRAVINYARRFADHLAALAEDTSDATRKEELLYHPDELNKIYSLRRSLKGVPPVEAMEMFIQRVRKRSQSTH